MYETGEFFVFIGRTILSLILFLFVSLVILFIIFFIKNIISIYLLKEIGQTVSIIQFYQPNYGELCQLFSSHCYL